MYTGEEWLGKAIGRCEAETNANELLEGVACRTGLVAILAVMLVIVNVGDDHCLALTADEEAESPAELDPVIARLRLLLSSMAFRFAGGWLKVNPLDPPDDDEEPFDDDPPAIAPILFVPTAWPKFIPPLFPSWRSPRFISSKGVGTKAKPGVINGLT
jgi:hypothetical protein